MRRVGQPEEVSGRIACSQTFTHITPLMQDLHLKASSVLPLGTPFMAMIPRFVGCQTALLGYISFRTASPSHEIVPADTSFHDLYSVIPVNSFLLELFDEKV